jgi:putative copper resistance protein D
VIVAALGILTAAAYVAAVRAYRVRFPARRFPASRVACFLAGVAAMTTVLLPAADALADRFLTAHMMQHLVLTLIGPPLLLLGAPLSLAVALVPVRAARAIARGVRFPPVHALLAPPVALTIFVAVLWIAHFSPLYEAALGVEWIHAMEHLLFVGTALLFWTTVVQVGYVPRPAAFAIRMFALFVAIPQGAFLGLAIYAAHRPLYAHYAAQMTLANALVDQRDGGATMWIGGGGVLLCALLLTAGAWAARERREAAA